MADLIDKQAAIDKLMELSTAREHWISPEGVHERQGINVAICAIEDLPSADAVEVVRCKDCKYYYYADNRIPSERGWACANDGCYVSQNDYCSWGERKDG